MIMTVLNVQNSIIMPRKGAGWFSYLMKLDEVCI